MSRQRLHRMTKQESDNLNEKLKDVRQRIEKAKQNSKFIGRKDEKDGVQVDSEKCKNVVIKTENVDQEEDKMHCEEQEQWEKEWIDCVSKRRGKTSKRKSHGQELVGKEALGNKENLQNERLDNEREKRKPRMSEHFANEVEEGVRRVFALTEQQEKERQQLERKHRKERKDLMTDLKQVAQSEKIEKLMCNNLSEHKDNQWDKPGGRKNGEFPDCKINPERSYSAHNTFPRNFQCSEVPAATDHMCIILRELVYLMSPFFDQVGRDHVNEDHLPVMERSINNLKLRARQEICRKLDVEAAVGGDYRELAAQFDIDNDTFNLIKQRPYPTEEVLKVAARSKENTIGKLRKILEDMKRHDCVGILKEFEEAVEAGKSDVCGSSDTTLA